MVGGRQRFGGGAVQIEEDNTVGTATEPWAGHIQRRFRSNRPEPPQRLCVQECNSLRHLMRVDERVGKADARRRRWNTHREAVKAGALAGIRYEVQISEISQR